MGKQTETAIVKSAIAELNSPAYLKAIAKVTTKYMTPEQTVRLVESVLWKMPQLCEDLAGVRLCTQEAHEMGLQIATPAKQAYILPFKDHGKVKATLVIGYPGFIALGHRTGLLRDVTCELIHANDQFSHKLGLNRDIVHIPAWGNRGAAIGCYCILHLTTGGFQFVVMEQAKILTFKDRSPSAKGSYSPWSHPEDWEWMWKKTLVKQAFKLLPLTGVLAQAMLYDEPDPTLRKHVESTVVEPLDLSRANGSKQLLGTSPQATKPPAQTSRDDKLKVGELVTKCKELAGELDVQDVISMMEQHDIESLDTCKSKSKLTALYLDLMRATGAMANEPDPSEGT